MPRQYASDAKLIVKVGRESVTLDPTATTSQTMVMQKTQEEEINSALAIVYSRRVKESVIERIGVEEILSGSLSTSDDSKTKASIVGSARNLVGRAGEFLLEIGVRDRVSDDERAIIKLDRFVHVSAPKKSRVITIYTEAASPEMARAITQAMSEAYIEEHMKISQTAGSFEFFSRETEKTATALKAAKQEMAKFMSEQQIVSVASNQELLKNTWNGILANIMTLENLEEDLAASYSKEHPRRAKVIEQLASARRMLDQINESTDVDVSKKLTDRQGKTVLADYEEAESLRKQEGYNESAKLKTNASLINRMERLVHANNALEGIQERVKTFEAQLALHRSKLEEARLIKEQQKNSISNVTVFQPATLNQKPISPNKALVGLATVFFGFVFAGALALLRDSAYRTKHLNSPVDVERTLKTPVIAQLHFDRSANRRSRSDRSLQKLRAECHGMVHSIIQAGQSQGSDRPSGVIVGVLGIGEGDGASTVASAIAGCCAKDFGLNTVLVDADRTKRSVARRFGLNGAPGLQQLVGENVEIGDCLQEFQPFELSLVSSSNQKGSSRNAKSFSISKALDRISDLGRQFDIVIVDLPHASAADAVVSMAPLLENIILVAEQGSTRVDQAVGVLRKFDACKAELRGVVLNKCQAVFPWQKF